MKQKYKFLNVLSAVQNAYYLCQTEWLLLLIYIHTTFPIHLKEKGATLTHQEIITKYKRIILCIMRIDKFKNTLELENFSGKTVNSVYQDFFATAVLANVISIVAAVADTEIVNSDAQKHKLKYYVRKANRNTIARNLVLPFLTLMVEPNINKRQIELGKLFKHILKNTLPIVPDRNPRRKSPRKKKFHRTKRK